MKNCLKSKREIYFTCKWVLILIAGRWEGLFLDGLRLTVSAVTPGHRFPG